MPKGSIPVLLFLLLSLGCYYGAMQPAHTLGENHVVFRGNLLLPAYFSSEDRREAEETREGFLEIYPSGDISIGTTDRIDIGFSFTGYGLGPHFKINTFEPTDNNAVSALLNINYVIPAKVINPRLTLMAGRNLSNRFEVYGGYQLSYGPEFQNLPENEEGKIDWDGVDFGLSHALFLGCFFQFHRDESVSRYSRYLPEGITIEFGIPLGFEKPMLITGLGFVY